ncbi:MAG: S-layer homology domain-containing protein [Clostridia bacterium]|nr:S-layer homology domain-containing protein [Clostridia bacterium]
MKKKWIWLLSALLLAVIILPAAAFANDPIELFADANKAEFKTAVLTVPEGQEVALWTTDPAGIAEVNNGTVTAKAAGTTVVRALAEDKDEGGNFTGYSVIDSWDIVVKNRTAVEIKVATMPTKLDTYVSGDKFDKAGMVVTVDFDSTETEVTTNYTVSPTTALSAGTQEITVTYTPKPELTASFNVTVQEVKLVDFIIVDPRDKFTVGDKLPEMGIEIELIYNNGKRQTVVADDSITITPSTALKKTDKTYTVKVEGVSGTKSRNISVQDPAPVESVYKLVVSGTPTTKTYKVGDKFDPKGMTLKITKDGADYKTLTDTEAKNAINYTFVRDDLNKTSFSFPVKYTVDGKERTFDPISVTGLKIENKLIEIDVLSRGAGVDSIKLNRTKFPVGYTVSTNDVKSIFATAYIESENRPKSLTIQNEDFGEYDWDIDFEVLTAASKRKTSLNRRHLIEEDDVTTNNNSGKKYVTLALVIDDYIVFYEDYEVGDSAVTLYYTRTSTIMIGVYDNLRDCIDDVNDPDLTAFAQLATVSPYSGTFSIKLGENQSISRTSIEPSRNLTIDLNGHKLSLYSTSFSFSRSNTYSVTVTNTSATQSQISFTDATSYVPLLDKGEKIVFKYNAQNDNLPGVYTVSISEVKNGTVTAKPAADRYGSILVAHGNDVVFTIIPAANYEIDTINYNKKAVSTSGSNYSKDKDGVVTYTVKDVLEDGTLAVTFKQKKAEEKPVEQQQPAETPWDNPFRDVPNNATYIDAIKYVSQNGLMNGVSATSFEPNGSMTRAQFVTTLGRMHFSDQNTVAEKFETVKRIYGTASQFTDVKYNDAIENYGINYAVPYINWASSWGIVNGVGDGKFDPNAPITHQEMYLIMQRYAMYVENIQIGNLANVRLTEPDANKIGTDKQGNQWGSEAREKAENAIKYAKQQNFLLLSGGLIEPSKDATRYELAMLLYKFSVNVLGN